MEVRAFATRLTAALAVLLLSVALTVGSGLYNLYWPKPVPLGKATPDVFGLPNYRPVTLRAADGVSIAGWYVPKRSGNASAAVLVLPERGTDKSAVLPHVSFLADEFDVLAIDFRRTGGSEETMSTIGVRERLDADAGIAYLKARGADKVGIYGFGLGGSVALSMTRRPDVAAVVGESSYPDLRRLVKEPYRPFGLMEKPFQMLAVWTSGLFGLDLVAASPISILSGVKIPVFVIRAAGDMMVSDAETEQIMKALVQDPAAESWRPEGMARGEGNREFAGRLQDFFRANLK